MSRSKQYPGYVQPILYGIFGLGPTTPIAASGASNRDVTTLSKPYEITSSLAGLSQDDSSRASVLDSNNYFRPICSTWPSCPPTRRWHAKLDIGADQLEMACGLTVSIYNEASVDLTLLRNTLRIWVFIALITDEIILRLGILRWSHAPL
jgi:hypothetical protein